MTSSDIELRQVRPGVHAWIQSDGSWWLNNAGVVVTDTHTVVVDACADRRRTADLLHGVRTVAAEETSWFLVATHHHGDHTFGASVFPKETTYLMHEGAASAALAEDSFVNLGPYWDPMPDRGGLVERSPDVLVGDRAVIKCGRDVEVVIAHPGGAAHSAGDCVAWVPSTGVLFSGDLIFNRITPLVLGGSLAGARAALTWMAGFEPEVVIPGHGPVIAAEELPGVLRDLDRYYELVQSLAREGLAKGAEPFQVAQTADLGLFADWPDSERLVLNLHRAYVDLTGEPLDRAAAFADMVALVGGPVRTCL